MDKNYCYRIGLTYINIDSSIKRQNKINKIKATKEKRKLYNKSISEKVSFTQH